MQDLKNDIYRCLLPNLLEIQRSSFCWFLEKGLLHEEENVVYEMRTAKTTSKVKMFGAGPEIAEVHKGEKVITKIASTFDPDDTRPITTMTNVLRKIESPVWAHIFEEASQSSQNPFKRMRK